mmetsp:Transcript_27940/g.87047  ORF Transcript_27940/g.87047 Transcript_27940/m.87047 type:complete len:428 (-) Transcript_27940:98-1381(-)
MVMAQYEGMELKPVAEAEKGDAAQLLEEGKPEPPTYCEKITNGARANGPPQLPTVYSAWSFLGAMAGMSAIGLLHTYFLLPQEHMVLLVGAFGAMSVIVFSAYKVPVAQPYNVVVGNTLGGIAGVAVFKSMEAAGIHSMVWFGAGLSVSLTIVVQELTASVHPPGGATALIYVCTPPVQAMGWKYVFCPSLLGAVIMVLVACVTNNLAPDRTYPQYWWKNSEPASEASSGSTSDGSVCPSCIAGYFGKFRGANAEPAPKPPLAQTWNSWLGSFVGMCAIGLLHKHVVAKYLHEVLLIGAFGAMSVIIFSAWKVPFAQPKNAILGNTLGGLVGVSTYNVLQALGLGSHVWLGAALAVALTIVVQELTNTVHPPGGATALIFEIMPKFHALQYAFVLTPSCLGPVILVGVGLLTNNLVGARSYPQYWWP